MKTKVAILWERTFSATGSIKVPSGTPVEWDGKNKTYYVQPSYFHEDSILHHDAIHYGCRVNADNVTCEGINMCEHLKDLSKCPDTTCPRKGGSTKQPPSIREPLSIKGLSIPQIKSLIEKGYKYIIQFKENNKLFGEPICFKEVNDVGPFMRSYPNLSQVWNKSIIEYLECILNKSTGSK